MSKSTRIGPRMSEVVAFVEANPGRAMFYAAMAVAPRRFGRVGLGYGYDSVHRAIDAGLLSTRPGPRGATLLFPLAKEVA